MGGLLHLLECSQYSMSRTRKRHVNGFEAPRNSLELQTETSQNISAMGSNILYLFQAKQNSSETSSYASENSMKNLIDGEISEGPETRRNVPSVVARLMGMDALPSDPKLTIHGKEKSNEKTGQKIQREEQLQNVLVDSNPRALKHLNQREVNFISRRKIRQFDRSSCAPKFEKPRPREHPQEEELQKFKKEFEAWQAAMVWERFVELGRIPTQWLAQENLNKEKMALYTGSRRSTDNEKPIEPKHQNSLPIHEANLQESCALKHHGFKKEALQTNKKEPVKFQNSSKDLEKVPLINCDPKLVKSSVPTKIVILKPGLDRNGSSEDSWAGSSDSVEGEGSIEDFLEEVKDRLRCEIQGKNAKKDMVARGGGIEAPFREKLSDPKEIAHSIAKQVRQSVTKDLGVNLLRSESTRSYRSEIQVNGSSSPEFINRDTRKFLSERLRNVFKPEDNVNVLKIGFDDSRASILDNEGKRLRTSRDVMKTGNKGSCLKNVKDDAEKQTRSFRHGETNEMIHAGEVFPRNLVRSLSAPVSGTSLGKLLLEDRHILTGAHIRRNHEAAENVSVKVRKTRKARYSLGGKVSNLRSSFSLRGKLFGRKIQSDDEAGSNESDSMKDIMSGPSVRVNFGNPHENSTEVPPSPASVCSSAHEELCRPADHPSPVSTLDVPLIDDCPVPQVFREISSNLNELRRQLNELEYDCSQDMVIREEPLEAKMVELDDPTEAYIRDLLVASSLYDGLFDGSSSRWDPLGRPISNWVFKEVGESYRRRDKEEKEEDHCEKELDHKLLFDLTNEALSTILGLSSRTSRFKRKMISVSIVPPPCGEKLLDSVLEMIRGYSYRPMDDSSYTIDCMVERDIRMKPWSCTMDHDVEVIQREVERMILSELIGETVRTISS
ncbi:uncharacterized protein LOC122662119 [Telopea speciosissima]|uniref:uncharacterized protein LOC122662119 n=1 Tax=Telopea speciosissima TaxID=54955 RepID=UPI001CC63A35|nr:uncharacterized protein LOC122662119 [Telopea speciosissima]XP_043713616.1 uncharacterized protein LOC122662119 [Telopea speciosissima]XP_043713617.1 uncharacterized protein LOC122662119 [Telopea speciosissima]